MSDPLPIYDTQLEMVWPYSQLRTPPVINPPFGYHLRQWQPADTPRFLDVMRRSGWAFWDETFLQDIWIGRILPHTWFLLMHTQSDTLAATAMGVHSHSPQHPFGGEIGWVGSHDAHRGQGLGRVVCAAVTNRLIDMGYQHIHLYTEDFRLPALRTYLALGYVPLLTAYDPHRWQEVCTRLAWPFAPDDWGYGGF